jgi:SAM-dependent methyltransferase
MRSNQFHLLTSAGLRKHHRVLDIGCGTLGLGSLLIPYLLCGHYFGVEPQQALIEDGVRFQLGHDLFDQKQPQFLTNVDFAFYRFAVKFDYMMAHALFPNIGAQLIEVCLRNAAGSLQPNGLLLASWAPGPANYEGVGWNPHLQAEYKPARLQELAKDAGLEFKVLDYPHPHGHYWAAFFLPGCQNIPKDIVPTFSSLPAIAEGHSGYVERALDLGGYLLIEGWAIDPQTYNPADQILIANRAGTIRASVPIHLPRPDVAAVLGQEALMSGFRALIRNDQPDDPTYYAEVLNDKIYRIARK